MAVLVLITGVVITLWWAATSGLAGPGLVTARLDALKVKGHGPQTHRLWPPPASP
jgi:hypothetical protein